MSAVSLNFMIIPLLTLAKESIWLFTILKGTDIRLQVLNNVSPVQEVQHMITTLEGAEGT